MPYESSDARVALLAAYSRHPRAGDAKSHSRRQVAKPYVGKAMKQGKRPHEEVKDLGKGAFMKDTVFRRKADGTVVALASENVGLARVGRTIYGQGAHTPVDSDREKPAPATPGCAATAEESHGCPTLEQLAAIDSEEEKERMQGLTHWTASAGEQLWAGSGGMGYGSGVSWRGSSRPYVEARSEWSSAASTPTLSPSRSTDSSLEWTDWEGQAVEAALGEGADRIFDLYINADACGGHGE
ncbi:hypothetical protein FA95DRAFT_1600998 [Auriscalpium vulgare]|uniref:Uncharacterized protein n=1 Tax=Auriscalpium vulgare TaxID=40419 RepID=A0ACB8SBU2_9AGAM|nr:hypothetical protein FA95DRAFT_1600998 [Auriscalpium vulgare]